MDNLIDWYEGLTYRKFELMFKSKLSGRAISVISAGYILADNKIVEFYITDKKVRNASDSCKGYMYRQRIPRTDKWLYKICVLDEDLLAFE